MKGKVVGGFLAAVALVFVAGGLINSTTASKGDYQGRVFIAGMGGHIADATVVIDPSNNKEPIKIPNYTLWTGNKLHFIPLGPPPNYAVHDVRIDSQDGKVAFWSTYASNQKSVMVGKTDLATNSVIAEKTFDLPKAVLDFDETVSATLYCASGESKDYFLPIFMGYPGFIDVVDKKTLDLKHRVMLSDHPDIPTNYKFTHGVQSPDHKHLFIVMNDAVAEHGKFTGKQHLILLDMAALENGKLEIVKMNTVDFPKGAVTFRATYTPDGKYILQSAKTHSVMLNADDLTIKQVVQMDKEGWENHDVMPTPDGLYGISAIRIPVEREDGKKVVDGMIGLWDLTTNKYIGEPVSVCRQCHLKNQKHFPLTTAMDIVGCTRCHQDKQNRNSMDVLGNTILCGLDGQLTRK